MPKATQRQYDRYNAARKLYLSNPTPANEEEMRLAQLDLEDNPGGLTAVQKAKCARCKHGRAAHVKDGKCHMKHCKCESFHA